MVRQFVLLSCSPALACRTHALHQGEHRQTASMRMVRSQSASILTHFPSRSWSSASCGRCARKACHYARTSTDCSSSAWRRMLPQRSTRTSSSARRCCVPDGRRLAATLTDSFSTDDSSATEAASAPAVVDEGAEEEEPTGPEEAAVATAE